MKKVLLLEPNYSNKYPPIGLMKIATYHRNRGDWDIVFYKGDLKTFVIERIADKCIADFIKIDDSIDWITKKDLFIESIRNRNRINDEKLELEKSNFQVILTGILDDYKKYFRNGKWKQEPEWDRIFVTTLFTFYWDITVETIEFAKWLVKDIKNLMVGGVLASIQPEELEKATGIKPFVGVLNTPGQLDEGDTQIIDSLPLDYSILDEIDYKYPMSNAYYGYMTRGCIRNCAFCAVKTMEPEYVPYISLADRIEGIRNLYGEQKDLLLMDNNVLASAHFSQIIQEIIDCGFGKGDKFVQPNLLEIAIRNLKDGINDRAYIRKAQGLLLETYEKITNREESFAYYSILAEYHLLKIKTTTKENLLQAYPQLIEYYNKHHKPLPRNRYVDFNQGLDARLFTEEKAKQLASISIRPLRIAFDDIKTFPEYDRAIRWSAKAGIKDFSNYLLYNFKDEPIDLYRRLRINVEMCDELGINVYSFPMKYHPLRKEKDGTDYSHNRDYIGKHWNRKYIRAIQAILNSTKGKVGKGFDFFCKAFGSNEEEFMELLEMPETFILYRFFFEWLDERQGIGVSHWRKCWNTCMTTLSVLDKETLLDIIHNNQFTAEEKKRITSPDAIKLLEYYTNFRKDIITPGTQLYDLKQEYDSNPTFVLRHAKK